MAEPPSAALDAAKSEPEGRAGDCSCVMTRLGKKRAGRLLDGREWNEYPDDA